MISSYVREKGKHLGRNSMIDKSKEYWYGDSADDIDEYLREYSMTDTLDVKPVLCHSCGSEALHLRIDPVEGAIQVKCPVCGYKKILLDCDEIWKEAKPRLNKCPICKEKEHNVRVGFLRRESGSVRWVYVGNRCVHCGVLGSCLDWKVSFEPTDRMESNI